jgi:hypothetical protein
MKTLLSYFTAVAILIAMPAITVSAKDKTGSTKGSVTAVDDHSITVGNKKSGESKTFKIDDKTTISVDGADGKKAADIKTGMKAEVTAGDSDDAPAKAIVATSKKKKTTT